LPNQNRKNLSDKLDLLDRGETFSHKNNKMSGINENQLLPLWISFGCQAMEGLEE
jgi:hypothetical protein